VVAQGVEKGGFQLHLVHRLADEIVGPVLHGLDRQGVVTRAGDHDYWRKRRLGSDVLQEIQAEPVRKLLVKQDGIGSCAVQGLSCLRQGTGGQWLIAPVFQVHDQQLAEHFVVFYDEDIRHCPRPGLSINLDGYNALSQ
jgi:hypothetical protein